MKFTALHPAIWRRIVYGILLVSAAALAPRHTFAQRGIGAVGAGRAGAAGPGIGRSPGVGRPGVVGPGIVRPGVVSPGIFRPGVVGGPLTPLHDSFAPFGVLIPRGRRPFPIFPRFGGFPIFFGLGYSAFWFPNCNGFGGWGYGCGGFSLYDTYALGPDYSLNDYPPAADFSPDNLGPADSLGPADTLGVEGGIGKGLPQTILLYLKDGSVFAVSKYTVSDGKLHYDTLYGGQNEIDLDLLDLQKTIDGNASRGVTFTLTPPSSGPAAPVPIAPPAH
jgi:hypothetical protein